MCTFLYVTLRSDGTLKYPQRYLVLWDTLKSTSNNLKDFRVFSEVPFDCGSFGYP